jgi:hypothetical protein
VYIVYAIADAKYEKAEISEAFMADIAYLTVLERNDLYCKLLANENLFSGKLGCYPNEVFSLKLKPDAKLFNLKPYAVPRIHLSTFQKELDCLVEIGVLVPTGASLWAAGAFIIPKKDGTARFISDFRQLNEFIERLYYPLPQIQKIVQEQKPYQCFTEVDVSMQYHTFCLDDQSLEYCTIVTPFGKYPYTGLPMGVCQSYNFAQAMMEEVLKDLDNVTVYINGIKITHAT